MKWKKLLLIGDSNIQYGFNTDGQWASLLASFLQRKCDVINRGFSGYNTKHLKIMLPGILEEFEPGNTCGIIILLGSNDSAVDTSMQHVPIKEYRSNLESITDYITGKWGFSKEKIILLSPPRIDDSKWLKFCQEMGYDKSHTDELATKYARECTDLATEKQIACLDLNKLMSDKPGGFADLLVDGLHFSKEGSECVFENLKPIVEQLISNDLSFNYPYWKDINDSCLDTLKQ